MARRVNKFSHADERATSAERKHPSLVDAGKASKEANGQPVEEKKIPSVKITKPLEVKDTVKTPSEERPYEEPKASQAPEQGRGEAQLDVFIPSKETRSGRFNGCFRKSDLAKWKRKAQENDISLARFIERVMNDNCDNGRIVP